MSNEEPISAVEAASATLQDCLRQLASLPNEEGLIDGAQTLVAFLRDQRNGTLSPGELNRIDIGLSIAKTQLDTSNT